MSADAWTVADPTRCECGKLDCEDHLPQDLTTGTARNPTIEATEALAVQRAIRLEQEIDRQRIQRDARRQIDREDRGPITAPEFVTLAQLAAESEPMVSWRIEGWQPAGTRVIAAAARKTGKTTLVGCLVRSLVDGDPWLGHARVAPIDGSVAILDTEMSRNQLWHWLSAQQIVAGDRVIVVPLRGCASLLDLADADRRRLWVSWLRARGVSYLIVDCLRPVLDALGLDESHEAGGWLVGLDALLLEAAIPEACVVHHMGHTAERSRGDSRLRDWPDVEWRIVRQDDDDDASPRHITAYGRDVDVPETQLAYDGATRRLTLAGGSRREARTIRTLEAVIEVVGLSPAPLSGRAITEALTGAHPRDLVYAAIQAGVRAGRLTAQKGPRNGRYYQVSECPAVSECPSGQSNPDRVSECPNDVYTSDTPDTPRAPLLLVDGSHPGTESSGHSTGQRGHHASTGARNTARTRRLAQQAEQP
jgi:hypothetical protein